MPSLASNCSMSRLRYSRFLLVEEDRESHDFLCEVAGSVGVSKSPWGCGGKDVAQGPLQGNL